LYSTEYCCPALEITLKESPGEREDIPSLLVRLRLVPIFTKQGSLVDPVSGPMSRAGKVVGIGELVTNVLDTVGIGKLVVAGLETVGVGEGDAIAIDVCVAT
jgi:hypothetical protein